MVLINNHKKNGNCIIIYPMKYIINYKTCIDMLNILITTTFTIVF